MKRFLPLTVVSLAALCAGLVTAGTLNSSGRAVAAVRPTPTPTPVAIAYDEITRMAFAGVTPPPVGSFSGDYSRIMAAAKAPSTDATDSDTDQMPPQVQAILRQRMGGAGNPMASMQMGTLKRYTFYWVKGWIRIDDPVAQTATIYKCKERQTIYLDLAKKTYRIVTGATDTDDTTSTSGGANPYAREAMAPGTAKMTVTAKAAALGPKTVEGISTQGYDSTNSLAMTNATGSCRNGSFNSHVLEYISNINEQRPYCPLPGRAVSGASQYGGPAGGCKPAITARQTGSARPPANKLAMYRLSEFGSGQGKGGAMVLERGHVTWLYNPDIPPVFTIPADFKQQQ